MLYIFFIIVFLFAYSWIYRPQGKHSYLYTSWIVLILNIILFIPVLFLTFVTFLAPIAASFSLEDAIDRKMALVLFLIYFVSYLLNIFLAYKLEQLHQGGWALLVRALPAIPLAFGLMYSLRLFHF